MLRPRLVNASIVIASILLAVSLAEIGLRVKGLYRPPDNPIGAAQPEIYRSDSKVGYTLWPSRQTSYHYPQNNPEAIPLVSNSDGFRNSREFDERDERIRILVVGDSFIFGQGVRAEDRTTEILEAMEPGWRVDNIGMTGWGIDLMVRALDAYAAKANPDLVVMAICTDDFRRLLPYYAGIGYGYDKFELGEGQLVSVPFPYPRAWERLRVVQFIYQTTWNRNRNRYDLNEALLNRYLEIAQSVGFMPTVVFFPGQGNNAEDRERRAFLEGWTSQHKVPYLDITDAIHSAGIERVYITDNWHWNRLGHEIAAEQLHGFLTQLFASSSLN